MLTFKEFTQSSINESEKDIYILEARIDSSSPYIPTKAFTSETSLIKYVKEQMESQKDNKFKLQYNTDIKKIKLIED